MSPLVVIILLAGAALLWTRFGPTALGGGPVAKRCSRCWRAVTRLQPYIDGRREIWLCPMCAAELDIVNARRLDIPRN